MALSSLTAQVAGGIGQTVGAYYQAAGEKTALKLRARMNEVNARIAEGQARDVLLRGERQQQSAMMGAAQLKSRQRAAIAASGLELGSESAIALQSTTDYLSEMDVNQIKANALREAWGYRMEGTSLRGAAAVERATARGISPAGAAFSTLLTSAGQVAGSYATFKAAGMLDGPKPTSAFSGRGYGGIAKQALPSLRGGPR